MHKTINPFWIVFLIQAVQGFSQTGFNKIYDLNLPTCGFVNGMNIENDIYVYAAITNPTNFSQPGIGIIKMDTTGIIQYLKFIYDTTGLNIGTGENYGIIQLSNGNIGFTAGYFSSPKRLLIHMDTTGNIVLYKQIDYDIYHNQSELIELADGFLLGGSNLPDMSHSKGFITKTDKQGNVVWTKSYGDDPELTYNILHLLKLNDNTFVICSVIGKAFTWAQSHIYAIDSFGIVKWDFIGPVASETVVTCLQPLKNGQWLYATSEIYTNINPPYPPSWNKLVCRDSAWNLIWEKRISPTNWWRNQTFDMKPTPDGNFVVAARWAPGPGPEQPQWIGGCLYKVSPEGEEIWRFCDSVYWPVQPSYFGSEPFAGGLVVLPSGSVVFIGRTDWYSPSPARTYGWMYKVDANGCRYEPCSVGLHTPNSPSLQLDIFPNPAQDQLSIRLPYLSEEALIQVLDPMGRMVLQSPVPSAQESVQLWLGEHPAGLYAIRLLQKGRLLGVGKVLLLR